MLKDIWTLPRITTSTKPGAKEARESLWVLGKLLYHVVFPYLCVELSLVEQLEHLSAASHLSLVLFYQANGKPFLPTELYINLQLMIKNAYFCIAKSKIDDPEGSFWI
jgi:hypothetical protein